jgi:hypothetical protein
MTTICIWIVKLAGLIAIALGIDWLVKKYGKNWGVTTPLFQRLVLMGFTALSAEIGGATKN